MSDEISEAAEPLVGQVLLSVIEDIDDPYPTDIFTELSNEERDTVLRALHNCGVGHASERLHAHWARHLATVTRYRARKRLDEWREDTQAAPQPPKNPRGPETRE